MLPGLRRAGGLRVRFDPADRTAADAAMARYAEGDRAAGARLYDLLRPRLYAIALRWTRSASAAEDLVQDAFVKLTEARGSFHPGAHVLPWACAISRNLLTDGHRRRSFEHWVVETSLRGEGADGVLAPDDEGPDRHRLVERLRAAVASLPASQREPFQLIKFEGSSVKDVARRLGITEGMVKIRTFRAVAAIRADLQRRRSAP